MACCSAPHEAHDHVVTKCCIPHVASCSIFAFHQQQFLCSSSSSFGRLLLLPLPRRDADADARATGSVRGLKHHLQRGKLMPTLTMAGQLASALLCSGLALPFPFAATGRCPSRQGKRPRPAKRAWLVVPRWRWRWPRHVRSWVAGAGDRSAAAHHRTAVLTLRGSQYLDVYGRAVL